MSSKFSLLASAMPTFTKKDTVEAKVDALADYQVQLLDYLRYSMTNLDASNFNDSGLKEILEPVLVRIEGTDGKVTTLTATIDGINATVEGYKESVDGYSKQVSTFSQTVEGFRTQVENYGSDVNGYASQVSVFNQTVTGFSTQVSSYKTAVDGYSQQVSQFNQTATEISAKVSAVDDSTGKVTAASIVAAINSAGSTVQIAADHIKMTGTTTFLSAADVGMNGTTVIDGGRIKSGIISGIVLESPGSRDWENVHIHDGMVDFYSGYISDGDVGTLNIYANDCLNLSSDTVRITMPNGRYFEFANGALCYRDAYGNLISQAYFS